MKQFLQKLTLVLGPWLISLYLHVLGFTMRKQSVGFAPLEQLARSGQRFIYAFWHGRLLAMPLVYKGVGVTILVSSHRDGELIAKTVPAFGVDTVRGSTTRGWFGGLKGLLQAAAHDRDLAITPDGPQGPARKAQMGAVQIARATGLPIVPVSFSASKKKSSIRGTRSWSPTPLAALYTSAASP